MASFLFLNLSDNIFLWNMFDPCLYAYDCIFAKAFPSSLHPRKSKRSWCEWRRLRREIQMTGVANLLRACGNESGLFRPPFTLSNPQHLPPNLACHFSPWPLEKITLGSLQGPTMDHVKLLHLLRCEWRLWGGLNAEDWQLFEGVEGRGCEGGQCHTKEGQEGKISHPWRLWNLVHPNLLTHGLQTRLSVRGQSHKDKRIKL